MILDHEVIPDLAVFYKIAVTKKVNLDIVFKMFVNKNILFLVILVYQLNR